MSGLDIVKDRRVVGSVRPTWRRVARVLAGGSLCVRIAACALLSAGYTQAAQAGGLDAAVQMTLSKHPALVGKQAEVRSRQQEMEAVLGQRYPTFSVQASANDDSTQPASLSLRQPLWTFGRIESNVALASSEVQAEEADLFRLRRELIDQTAAVYAKVHTAQRRVELASQNVLDLGVLLRQIERREQGQLASKTDVALVQARLLQGRTQLAGFEGDVELAREELLALTQTPVQTSEEVEEKWTTLPELSALLDSILQGSPTLQLKEQLIAVARARVDQERNALKPTLYLQADRYINQANTLRNTVIGVGFESTFEGVGVVARGRVEAASARLDAATQDLLTARSALTRQVTSLWGRRDQKDGLADELRGSLRLFEELLASYKRQYTAGSKTWLDVINLQRETYEQRLQLLQAEGDWLTDSLKLSSLSGLLDKAGEVTK